jgi:signal transduction protein with GAF and PtsI domain
MSVSDQQQQRTNHVWVFTPYRSDLEQRQMYAQIEALRANGVGADEAIRRVAEAYHRGTSGVRANYYKWRKVLGRKLGVVS